MIIVTAAEAALMAIRSTVATGNAMMPLIVAAIAIMAAVTVAASIVVLTRLFSILSIKP